MRQTGMAFQRTRLSADRTLMSVISTSLALISFGFTIGQLVSHYANEPGAGRRFGITLIALGIVLIVLGIAYHVQFMLGLRRMRHEMTAEGLIHGESAFPPSFVLIVAILLLALGVVAIVSMIVRSGPFG
jgi:inner membrane protein YidH